MSVSTPNLDDDTVLKLLLAKLDTLVTAPELESNQETIKERIQNLDKSLADTNYKYERAYAEVEDIRRDIIAANERLEKIQEEFNKEVEKLNARVDSVSSSRSQYVQSALMLIVGALIPAVLNVLIKQKGVQEIWQQT